MEDLREPKKAFSKIGISFVAGTVLEYLLIYGYSLCMNKINPDAEVNMTFAMILNSLVIYGMTFPLIWLLARNLPAGTPERHSIKWWQFVLAAMMSYTLTICGNLAGTLITTIIGILKGGAVQNNVITAITGGNKLLNFLFFVILAPIAEEWLFRKVLVDRLLRYGQGIAIVVSGLMFGLFHGNLQQFMYAFLLGVFFAFIYVKTGNVKITMGLHACVNFLGGVVSAYILELINYEELLTMDFTDTAGYMDMIMGNLGGWIVYLGYMLFIFGMVIAGVVLFIVSMTQRKFKLESGEADIPKGRRFQAVILNPGMIIFCILWAVMIVIQLLA